MYRNENHIEDDIESDFRYADDSDSDDSEHGCGGSSSGSGGNCLFAPWASSSRGKLDRKQQLGINANNKAPLVAGGNPLETLDENTEADKSATKSPNNVIKTSATVDTAALSSDESIRCSQTSSPTISSDPNSTTPTTSKKAEEEIEKSNNGVKKLKSILKKQGSSYRNGFDAKEKKESLGHGKINSDRLGLGPSAGGRRTIFAGGMRRAPPVVNEGGNVFATSTRKKIKWNSMAKVAHVPSLTSISTFEMQRIWWQKSDYDEFKKTSRILAKALVEENSRVWLASTSVRNHSLHATMELASHWQAEHGSKWWCKFGHSRRGLEHITQIGVGRARQQKVVESIRAVLREQELMRIQKSKSNNGQNIDPRRLCKVSMSYTLQARERAAKNGIEDAVAMFQALGLSRPAPVVIPSVFGLERDIAAKKQISNTSLAVSEKVPAAISRNSSSHLDKHTRKGKTDSTVASKPLVALKRENSMSRVAAGFGQKTDDDTGTVQSSSSQSSTNNVATGSPPQNALGSGMDNSPTVEKNIVRINDESTSSFSMKKKATGFGQYDSTADLVKLAQQQEAIAA